MLKKWTLGIILLSVSLFSQATLITSSVDSIDMEGIAVTAYFADDTEETLIWAAMGATLAGVSNADWSLTLDGDTFGQNDGPILYGLWTLTNIDAAFGIVGLSVDAGIKGFYFDILNGFALSTPGSGAGREFVSSDPTVTATYDDDYSADLKGILSIDWAERDALDTGGQLLFLTDTDKVEVPEPSTLFIFAMGLFALTLRKKSSGK